jgi:hypothetical protein
LSCDRTPRDQRFHAHCSESEDFIH